jgi:hypothetical protein
VILCSLLTLPLARAVAQVPPAPLPLSVTEDARTLPKGTVRLRGLTAWTRFDHVYGGLGDSTNGAHPLGDLFSAPHLGVDQISSLASAQTALRTLTGNAALRLDAGQLVTTANSRIVTIPLTLEYGLTDRLTVGVTVPVVQTTTNTVIELNPRALPGIGVNTGPNPGLFTGNTTARAANLAVYDALSRAHADLTAALAACPTNPTSTVCSQPDAARQAQALSDSYRAAVQTLYGTDPAHPGSPFVPTGPVQNIINSQLAALDASLQTLLGQSYLPTATRPAGAAANAALLQLQQLLTNPAGVAFDSLGSPTDIGIGDVEVSAALRLFDDFADTTRTAWQARAAIRGVLRLGTGKPADGLVPFAIGTGTGQTSADGAAVLDVRFPARLMMTLLGQYTAYFGSTTVHRMPGDDYSLFPLDVPIEGTWRAGNTMQIEATPRYLLSDYFTVHGNYSLRRQAGSTYTSPNLTTAPLFDAATEQRIGFGFAYSTLARYAQRRASVPFEAFFTQMQTIAASGGLTPRYARTQLELRVYYRLRRGR